MNWRGLFYIWFVIQCIYHTVKASDHELTYHCARLEWQIRSNLQLLEFLRFSKWTRQYTICHLESDTSYQESKSFSDDYLLIPHCFCKWDQTVHIYPMWEVLHCIRFRVRFRFRFRFKHASPEKSLTLDCSWKYVPLSHSLKSRNHIFCIPPLEYHPERFGTKWNRASFPYI